MTSDQRRLFLTIFALGMVLRVAWALAVPVNPVSDSVAYEVMATTLLDHGVYGFEPDEPTAYWAVGTSAIAAVLFYLADGGYEGIVALNLLASALILYTVQRICARWFDEASGLAAMALIALWPNLIFFTTILSSELYFIALMLAGLYFWDPEKRLDWRRIIVCGLLWGLACYVKPIILLVPAALAIADVLARPARLLRSSLMAGLVTLLICAVVFPWSERNREVFGERVMVSTNFGPNLWMGNNPDSDGGYMELPPEVAAMTETERASYLKDQAVGFIVENPGATAIRTMAKAARLHSRETIGVVWNEPSLTLVFPSVPIVAFKLVSSAYWLLVLIAAVTGIGLLARRRGLIAAISHPATALWVYFTLVHAVIVVGDRYHMPSSPFIAALSGYAMVRIGQSTLRYLENRSAQT